MKRLSVLATCLFFIVLLHAQRFGGNAPYVKWKQVNNTAARVIFPAGMDTIAQRIAAIEKALSASTLPTIGNRQQRIDIVLHPNTIVSNGYVALGPFRSEFYLTPSQNSLELGSIRWQDLLAMHEYRHVQQYNNFNVGLSHAFRIVFGQEGQEFANALAIPNWFWEGDAVYQETLVSDQGRGRLPFFFDDYRSLWLAHKHYSYMKLRNGSLRDFTPDHYRLGYMMVAYGRKQYGDDFWKKVTHDAASFSGLFYPFQHAVKQYSGKSFSAFTSDALNHFKAQSAMADAPAISHRHFLADQEFPVLTDSNTVYYVRTTYKKLPAFIVRNNQSETTIRIKDVSLDNQFSYANGKIVYSSYRPAIRWAWNDYNEIQILDVATGQQKTITRKSKYFSPALSADAKTVVAVDVQPGSRSHLHLLDAGSGQVIKVLANDDSLFYTYPKFVNDQQLISAVRSPSGKMFIAYISTATGATEMVTPETWRVLANPTVLHDTIYFTAADRGYDRLFAYTAADKKIFRVGLPANGVGVYQPAVSSDKIVFTSFTADGYQMQVVPRSSGSWEIVGSDEWSARPGSFEIDFTQNRSHNLIDAVKTDPLQSKKYAQTTGFFNFHSLLPYVDDPDYNLSLVGNNILNTTQSEIFVAYNRNEQYKQLGADITYGGWYPYINAGGNYIFDRRDFFTRDNRLVYWNEGQVNAGLSVPLNLSKGRSLVNLTLGSDYVLKTISYQGVYKDSFRIHELGYINGYISFTHQIQQARQHIYPRFAQAISINYRTAVQSVTARQFLVSGSFYFPGFALTHNIVVNLAYQNRDTLNQYRYSNSFPFSRGYESSNIRDMYKWGINYHLPLAYPDAGIANIVYFLRVRANAFYDYTKGNVLYRNGYFNTAFRSAGAEIFFDTKWWNELPLNFGFRYSHLLDPDLFAGTGSERFEFILPVNLFQR